MMNNNELEVIYEDNHIIVVVKKPDLLSQADDTQDDDMINIIKQYLKEKYHKPGNVFVGLVHRLDRRVGGLMVFAKTSKAASRLSATIRERAFYKEYFAIVQGITPPSGRLVNYVSKISQNGPHAIISTPEAFGQEAILEYRTISSAIIDEREYSFLKVNLITGRYNQIRIQFAHFKHPIINDFKYGYRGHHEDNQLGLVCSGLRFSHPVTKEEMNFNYMPKDGIWKYFGRINYEQG
ncbi:MAG: RluA family pseudouridine synthase [Bacilli bacterium]